MRCRIWRPVTACPIAFTKGQARGFLITRAAPHLQAKQRVLYLGDWDLCGHQIEAHTRDTLEEFAGLPGYRATIPWERVALTDDQVAQLRAEREAAGLDDPMIRKADNRYKPPRYFDAVETEALGQARIVEIVRDRLDELIPEPIDSVLERQRQQRETVADRLRELDAG